MKSVIDYLRNQETIESTRKKLKRSLIIGIIIWIFTIIINNLWEKTPIIIHVGSIKNYSAYGEYEGLMKFIDITRNISITVVSIAIIIILIIGLLRLIINKSTIKIKLLMLINHFLLAISILPLIYIAQPLLETMNGVQRITCWCGYDYVKIENRQ